MYSRTSLIEELHCNTANLRLITTATKHFLLQSAIAMLGFPHVICASTVQFAISVSPVLVANSDV